MSSQIIGGPAAAPSPGLPRALVIGGSRFIGVPLVEQLVAAAYRVTVLNRGRDNSRLPRGVETIACDRTDHAALKSALAGQQFEVAFDCVAYRPEDTEGLLAALDRSRLAHLVHVSTGSVYLPTEAFPLGEGFPRGTRGPGHEYGDRKYLIEEILFKAHRAEGLPVTIIRPGIVFGPGNYVYREAFFFDRLLAGRPLLVPNDGSVLVQFGYVADLATMMVAVLGNERAIGEAYNFAGRYAVTTDNYLREVGEVVGNRFGEERPASAGPPAARGEIVRFEPQALELAPAEVRRIYPYRVKEHVVRDVSKAEVQLGWRESVGLREGLRHSFAWYMNGGRELCGFSPDYALEDQILARLGR